MLTFYTEEDLQVINFEETANFCHPQTADFFPCLCICFQIICHQAHRSGVGHVTTKINIE